MKIDQRHLWRAVGIGTGLAASVASRRAAIVVWRRTRGTPPPTNPEAPGVSWPEALAWTVTTGVALGIARLLAQKAAAEAWRKRTGSYPAALQEVSP